MSEWWDWWTLIVIPLHLKESSTVLIETAEGNNKLKKPGSNAGRPGFLGGMTDVKPVISVKKLGNEGQKTVERSLTEG